MPFFDPHEELAGTNYDPIPDGEHTCIINSSAWKDSSSGGNYLEIEFSIFGGQFEGRMIWDRLNLVNKNDMAVQIAREGLARFCRVFECTQPLKNPQELQAFMMQTWGKKCLVKVKNQPRKNNPDQIDLVVKNVRRLEQPEAAKPAAKSSKKNVDVKDPDALPF